MTPEPEKPETRDLWSPLTEAEFKLRQQELAEAERLLTAAELAVAIATVEWKEHLKALQKETSTARGRLSTLGRTVREKRELRAVLVSHVPNHTDGTVDTVREDTGEIIASRQMDEEEKQAALFPRTRPRAIEAQAGA